MFVEDIKNDFYNVLLGNRVLLLVHYDVDAVCACKILQDLFKCDNISYTLVPVGGISELKCAYEENSEEVKFVVLINCGGTIDLVDILQPEEDVVFFVLDSHKPTDVCNVYSDGQVRLVYKDEDENIPSFDDIFRDDEDEEEEIEAGLEGLEAAAERRRTRRAWEERRHTLMFNYTQFSYYGKPSACVLVELCWRLSRVWAGNVWCGAVGAAEATVRALAPPARALLAATALYQHAASAPHAQAARVTLEQDAVLPLYRSWSVLAALRHAPALGPRLQLHAPRGDHKLRQIAADMGFPLQQARQAYRAMDVELRRSLVASLEAAAGRHRLPAPTAPTFLLHRPHRPTASASDAVYTTMALLEHESLSRAARFERALAGVSVEVGAGGGGVGGASEEGGASAREKLSAVGRLAAAVLAPAALHLAGPFTYFVLAEGTPDVCHVSGPLWLGVLARWVATAAVAGGGAAGGAGGAGGSSRPLVACAPAREPGTTILLGIPPRFDTEPRNLFGAAFEQAASRSGASVSLDLFDSSVITLPTSQRPQFLDALTALLA